MGHNNAKAVPNYTYDDYVANCEKDAEDEETRYLSNHDKYILYHE